MRGMGVVFLIYMEKIQQITLKLQICLNNYLKIL